jgi:hypothetical protein
MNKRITIKDLSEAVQMINELLSSHGSKMVVDWSGAYGMVRLTCDHGGKDLSGYGTKKEFMEYAYGMICALNAIPAFSKIPDGYSQGAFVEIGECDGKNYAYEKDVMLYALGQAVWACIDSDYTNLPKEEIEEIESASLCFCGNPSTRTAPCGEKVCPDCFREHVSGSCTDYACQNYSD